MVLKCKFFIYFYLKKMLFLIVGLVFVEVLLYDLFWGGGCEGEGFNYFGRLFM